MLACIYDSSLPRMFEKVTKKHVMVGLVVAIIIALIAFIAMNLGNSGMVGQYMPHVSGLDMISDEKPALLVKTVCQKCGSPNVRVCSRCGGCPNCRAEDKCGDCQGFQRQVSLDERSRACVTCGHKRCKCPSATGRPIEKEPGLVRGVFSEPTAITY